MKENTATIRWGVLLALLTLAFLLQPLFGTSRLVQLAGLALFEVAIIGSIYSSAENMRVRILGTGLAVLWFLVSIAYILGLPVGGLLTWLSLILVLGALGVTFHSLMRRGQGDVDTLLGAIFGYLLVAMAWAMLFVQIERRHPGSFVVPEGSDIESSMLYYSLVTLTTLGYGDVLPATDLARVAAGFEAVVGVLYIAVMVGTIVGNLKPTRDT